MKQPPQIESLIYNAVSSLPPNQKKVANFFLEHINLVAFKFLRLILIFSILGPNTTAPGQSIKGNHSPTEEQTTLTNKMPRVKPGIDVLLEKRLSLISGKRLGLITNATGVTSQLVSTVDALNSEIPSGTEREKSVQLVALFSPEHGGRGDVPAGQMVPQYLDNKTGVTVYSLYGRTRKPTPEMLKHIDVLLYDIQDIGSRAYTYIYTMAYAMAAARDKGIPFIVLDRPNPLGGHKVEGNVLDPKFSSFVGLYPIPQVYGMTVGELAQLFNSEFGIGCQLIVVPMEGWQRDMTFEDTGLLWIPTSPHVPHAETAYFEAATGCLGELDTISNGVGYTSPFELIGAPWIEGEKLAQELNSRHLPGVYFRPVYFKPFYYKFINQQCSGVQLHLLDKKAFSPAATQIHILTALRKLYPEHNIFDTDRVQMFDKAFGTDHIRLAVLKGVSAEEIIRSWDRDLEKFRELRKKYLLY